VGFVSIARAFSPGRSTSADAVIFDDMLRRNVFPYYPIHVLIFIDPGRRLGNSQHSVLKEAKGG